MAIKDVEHRESWKLFREYSELSIDTAYRRYTSAYRDLSGPTLKDLVRQLENRGYHIWWRIAVLEELERRTDGKHNKKVLHR